MAVYSSEYAVELAVNKILSSSVVVNSNILHLSMFSKALNIFCMFQKLSKVKNPMFLKLIVFTCGSAGLPKIGRDERGH